MDQVRKQTGETPPELEQPEITPELFEIVDLYWICRDDGGLTMTGLDAYCRMSGTVLTDCKIRLLKHVDNVTSRYLAKRLKRETKKTTPPAPRRVKGR